MGQFFSSFSHYSSNFNWKKQSAEVVLEIQTRGCWIVGVDGSTELSWPEENANLFNYIFNLLKILQKLTHTQ